MADESIFRIDFNNPKKAGGIPSFIPWALAAILAIGVGVMGYLLYTQKPVQTLPAWQVPQLGRDIAYSDIANHASSFVSSLMNFTESGFQEHLKNLNDLCLPEYSEKLQLVIENPSIADLIKQKKVRASTTIDSPRILDIGNDGKIKVFVTGKLTLDSPVTNFASVSRYFKVTLIMVKTNSSLKIANAIWKIFASE